MINSTGIFSTSCRGTIDNMLTFHAGGLGFNSRCWKCFFFLFFGPFVVVGFFSRKTYFHILTDLKYTGRLIAAFISTSYSQVPFDFPSVFFFFRFWIIHSFSTAIYILQNQNSSHLQSQTAFYQSCPSESLALQPRALQSWIM